MYRHKVYLLYKQAYKRFCIYYYLEKVKFFVVATSSQKTIHLTPNHLNSTPYLSLLGYPFKKTIACYTKFDKITVRNNTPIVRNNEECWPPEKLTSRLVIAPPGSFLHTRTLVAWTRRCNPLGTVSETDVGINLKSLNLHVMHNGLQDHRRWTSWMLKPNYVYRNRCFVIPST